MIKYGVIGTQLLYDDLQCWDSLYIAGRMQKPVLMLKDYAKLPLARKNNLDAAFTMALLLLPENFSLQVSNSSTHGHTAVVVSVDEDRVCIAACIRNVCKLLVSCVGTRFIRTGLQLEQECSGLQKALQPQMLS